MADKLAITRDGNSIIDYGFNISAQTTSYRLAAGGTSILAIPENYKRAIFTTSLAGDFIVGVAPVTPPLVGGITVRQWPINLPWRTDLWESGFLTETGGTNQIFINCIAAGDIYIALYLGDLL